MVKIANVSRVEELNLDEEINNEVDRGIAVPIHSNHIIIFWSKLMISNTIYTSPVCSCVFCKEIKKASGILIHYRAHHGTAEERQKQCAGLGHGSNGQKAIRIEKYQQNPTRCKCCNSPLDYERRKNKFCSSSCSATYNNIKRGPRSQTSRAKISSSLKEYNQINARISKTIEKTKPKKVKVVKLKKEIKSSKEKRVRLTGKYCKVSFCCVCNSVIRNSIRKTCSNECYIKHQSMALSKRLADKSFRQQHQYGRNKLSYLEQSFINWLNERDVYYLHEPSFKNWEENKTYFPDFYFPKFKLIIELDGTQHRQTQEQDQVRDRYIKSTYDIDVVRITHKEYVKKLRIDEICKLLEIKE